MPDRFAQTRHSKLHSCDTEGLDRKFLRLNAFNKSGRVAIFRDVSPVGRCKGRQITLDINDILHIERERPIKW